VIDPPAFVPPLVLLPPVEPTPSGARVEAALWSPEHASSTIAGRDM
jgi:hypothetical protein